MQYKKQGRDFMKTPGQEVINNSITICGIVKSCLEFDHELHGESYYKFYIASKRMSDADDTLPILISERLIENISSFEIGKYVEIYGQIRTYNKYSEIEGKNRLIVLVFTQNYATESLSPNKNDVFLKGYICKPPVYRITPFGREIADILLAVNRKYGKSDYVPCIAWGRNARYAGMLEVGDNIKLEGRLQSREYQKWYEDAVQNKIAYEVSIQKLNLN